MTYRRRTLPPSPTVTLTLPGPNLSVGGVYVCVWTTRPGPRNPKQEKEDTRVTYSPDTPTGSLGRHSLFTEVRFPEIRSRRREPVSSTQKTGRSLTDTGGTGSTVITGPLYFESPSS